MGLLVTTWMGVDTMHGRENVVGMPVFAFATWAWANYSAKAWEVRSTELAMEWGTVHYHDTEGERAEYREHSKGEIINSPVTGKPGYFYVSESRAFYKGSRAAGELSFRRGERLVVTRFRAGDPWWAAYALHKGVDSEHGWVPHNLLAIEDTAFPELRDWMAADAAPEPEP